MDTPQAPSGEWVAFQRTVAGPVPATPSVTHVTSSVPIDRLPCRTTAITSGVAVEKTRVG
jgi:hypothetical protein